MDECEWIIRIAAREFGIRNSKLKICSKLTSINAIGFVLLCFWLRKKFAAAKFARVNICVYQCNNNNGCCCCCCQLINWSVDGQSRAVDAPIGIGATRWTGSWWAPNLAPRIEFCSRLKLDSRIRAFRVLFGWFGFNLCKAKSSRHYHHHCEHSFISRCVHLWMNEWCNSSCKLPKSVQCVASDQFARNQIRLFCSKFYFGPQSLAFSQPNRTEYKSSNVDMANFRFAKQTKGKEFDACDLHAALNWNIRWPRWIRVGLELAQLPAGKRTKIINQTRGGHSIAIAHFGFAVIDCYSIAFCCKKVQFRIR